MDIILWMLFGAITAWIATIFIGTNTPHRIASSVALGMLGAVFAGTVMWLLTGHQGESVNYYSLLLAVAGSLLIVVLATHKKA